MREPTWASHGCFRYRPHRVRAPSYCLARDIGDHRAAYARYEQRMRPFVALNQALATENPGGPASEESVARAKDAISLNSWGGPADGRPGRTAARRPRSRAAAGSR
ncbi:hypothetical protein ACFWG6_07840 [Streptomyces erythrochromogenes]|uniref:hypothetical protein n=1 Tax=Streptomyces erythrochromogenes TaxID=285574 RepID=UPI00363407BE